MLIRTQEKKWKKKPKKTPNNNQATKNTQTTNFLEV